MYQKIFTNAGLSPTQADILSLLYEQKEAKASDIAKKIKKTRTIVYKDLDYLANIELVERLSRPGKIDVFQIGHPGKLEKFFDERDKSLKKERNAFLSYLPDMISSYNLIHAKPGVRYYEGMEGIEKALNQIAGKFQDNTELLTFVKVLPKTSEEEKLKEILSKYSKKERLKNIKTKIIAIDNTEGRELKEKDIKNQSETRLVGADKLSVDVSGEIIIYKDVICSITKENNIFFALLIENNAISQLLRAFFEAEWKSLESS